MTKLESRVLAQGYDEVTITQLNRWRIADDKKNANDKIVKLVDEDEMAWQQEEEPPMQPGVAAQADNPKAIARLA